MASNRPSPLSTDLDTIIDNELPIIDIDQGFSRIFTGFGSLDTAAPPRKYSPRQRCHSQPIPIVRMSSATGSAMCTLPMVSSSLNLNSDGDTQIGPQLARCWKL